LAIFCFRLTNILMKFRDGLCGEPKIELCVIFKFHEVVLLLEFGIQSEMHIIKHVFM